MAANLSGMTWWEYVRKTVGTDVQTVIAERADVAQATVSRWKLGKQAVDARGAIAFARATGRPAVEALVVAGYLKPEEARAQVTITRHEDPSDEELLGLIQRRLERDQRSSDGHQSAPTSPPGGSPAPVTPLRPEPVSDPDASLYLAADDRDPREEQEGRED